MRFFVFLLGLSIAFFSSSQETIEWSQLLKTKGQVNKILPNSGSDFYTIRFQGGALLGSNYFSHHENFLLQKTGKIKAAVENSTATIEYVCMINNAPYAILMDKVGDKKILYAQKYSPECKPIDDPIKLSEYTTPKSGWKSRGYYNFLFSKNSDFFCVEYDVPGTKDENERFGYRIFTKDFEMIAQGEYELPYLKSEALVDKRYLSNTGDYFISVKLYKEEEKKRLFKDNTTLSKILLMHVTSSGLEEYELDLEGKRITDMTFSSDNDRIMTFSGLYGDKAKKEQGIKGVFYFRLNFDKKEIINSGFQEFDNDFITQDWTDRQKDRAERNEEKGKGSPELYNYEIKEMNTLSDGSIIGMLEQYYMNVVTYTDPRGYSRTTYYYHYNDIVTYKISNSGVFEWVKKIPKTQISTNDYGYFSSIGSYFNENHLVIFFNDHIKNYNEEGTWNSNNNYEASFTKRSNTVAKVMVDLKSGDINRTSFLNVKETKAIAIPKLFTVDYSKNEMILFMIYGKKEKFGLIHY